MSIDTPTPALGIRDAATQRYATAMGKCDGSAARASTSGDSFAAAMDFLAASARLDGERVDPANPLRRLPSAR